jgi:hypothetical protein
VAHNLCRGAIEVRGSPKFEMVDRLSDSTLLFCQRVGDGVNCDEASPV